MTDINEFETESLTFRLKKSLKLQLPTAYETEDGKVKFKHGKAATKFVRKAIKHALKGNQSINNQILIDGLLEFNKLMGLVKPSENILNKINIENIRKAIEEI